MPVSPSPAVNKGYPHKPTKMIEVDGEKVRVRYPDRQTTKVWELQQAGFTHTQISEQLKLSTATVNTELRLYRQTLARDWPIEELRSKLATLAPKAIIAIEDSLDKKQALTALRLMEGLGVLNPKLDLRVTTDNQPTEDQLLTVGRWARNIPALRTLLLDALDGVPAPEDTTDRPGEPASSQGILSQSDPGTPEDEVT